MCPVCIATAALIVGKVTSASGAAAIAVRKLGGRKRGTTIPLPPHPSYLEMRTQQAGTTQTQTKKRDDYANDRDSEREDRVA
jgi:hypothetical protein